MKQKNPIPDAPAAFICDHCSRTVAPEGGGTRHRNHCPYCLWSVHLDIQPGDRRCGCRGEMEPIAVWIRRGGEWAIIHRCRSCSTLRSNRIAGDDSDVALMSLAVRPLAMPPFPLDQLGQTGG